ncbi:hypothetical protein B7463_g5037, partial [Scytalidium lignicola]
MVESTITTQERQLCEFLKTLPRVHRNRYDQHAERELLYSLFWSLAGGQDEHMRLLFPEGKRPSRNGPWKLRTAQGGADGDEFTEAARGKACGHIFKGGEATYRCKTCSADDTCVLCSRCYDSSDHTGHMVYVSVSLGNSGCCDCGDPEAWRLPVHCTIHTAHDDGKKDKGKGKEAAGLPPALVESLRMTIGRAFDYICDVISCSPEQLRLPKSVESIRMDERMSRLSSLYYDGDIVEEPTEYALLLWNDEKHTVNEVRDQVARACKVTMAEGLRRAHETDDVGRSIVKYSTDIEDLLRVSRIIEQIKVTVTIRSARDTFREQMCGTIIEWLSDIAGCSVGNDHSILRQIVCEEMLKPWRTGSAASNADVGMKGIDDHEKEEHIDYRRELMNRQAEILRAATIAAAAAVQDSDDDSENETFQDPEDDLEVDSDGEDGPTIFDVIMAEVPHPETDTDGDVNMSGNDDVDEALEVQEATLAGYPPPPPPPPVPTRPIRDRDLTPSDSDTAEPLIPPSVYAKANLDIPKTPRNPVKSKDPPKPARYWLETPHDFNNRDSFPPYEDLWQRVRLDWMILFDLRMWKKVRVDLRDLYISTVVTIPEFKRILGLRFSALYTTLAQLYLIADREPDHSIINISLQMLTTPSITAEIVERGNFLTNLMAILYTFLTTRQVGHPHEMFPNATLAFDSGSVTNRRMYHFFMDLRYLFSSPHVQEKLRTEDRYIMQFLDLVKLHQGICPNVRAVGEHVEYETDAWISASLITREINRLCRQFSESFKWKLGENPAYVEKAIRLAAKAVILHSLGTERKRFTQAEIKEEIKLKRIGDYEFETERAKLEHYIVKFVVEEQPISFHHALHYTLSWLIECGKSMSSEKLRQLLSFTAVELLQSPKAMGQRTMPSHEYTPEDHLMAAFDYPLRVCAWLAQMKASMWVRNGMSLRHQQGTYRGVSQRDVSHHRDIFLLQTAMVVCPPSRVLASIIDRYGMEFWMKGLYSPKAASVEEGQLLDIAEDLIHLLIVLVSDRTSLIPPEEEPNPHLLAMRRDIAHVLCFKPLSFSEICSKLPDKFQDQEECQDILDEMTTFKPPEGLSDVGTFELKEKFLEDIDPYIAHYNKNQREESENAYKNWMAKKTGRAVSEIVYEPKLRKIESGVFADLAAFTRTGLFAQIIYYSLLYSLKVDDLTLGVPTSRVETFLHVVLHLILIAVSEDNLQEVGGFLMEEPQSFVHISLTRQARTNYTQEARGAKTIVAVLEMLSRKDGFKSCHTKITLVLKRMKQKRPQTFETAFARLGVPIDRISTASPASINVLEDREKKKQAALERQAKVMAQFQQQQKNFLDNQGDIDWGEDDLSDETIEYEDDGQKNFWHYPSGTCILCQEETKDVRLYGTFALMTKSRLFRQTDFSDPDFVREAASTPSSLDRSAESIRPVGVAGENREQVHKITASGSEIITERQYIGRGFPSHLTRRGPVSVGCGHIMHYKCFEVYYEASQRRHQHQIARHHPERLEMNEFVCPLCKALGNAFLPIVWSPKAELYPGCLQPQTPFAQFIQDLGIQSSLSRHLEVPLSTPKSRSMAMFSEYDGKVIAQPLASKCSELVLGAWTPAETSVPSPTRWERSDVLDWIRPTLRTAANDDAAADAGDSIWRTGPGSSSSDSVSPMKELVDIYRRLRDTMVKNDLCSLLPSDNTVTSRPLLNEIYGSDVLAESLGYSISAVEIQQRGIAIQEGMTLVDSVPQQALTHLRILSETAFSYVSIGSMRHNGNNRVAKEFVRDYEYQHRELFLLAAEGSTDTDLSPSERPKLPLLRRDIFIFLTQCSLGLVPVDHLDIIHIIRLCYLAELVKVVLLMGRNMSQSRWLKLIYDNQHEGDEALVKFAKFCVIVRDTDSQYHGFGSEKSHTAFDQPQFQNLASCRDFVRKYALAFLRKNALLLYVRYGITFQNHIASDLAADELTRLTEALCLPSFEDMCGSVVFPTESSDRLPNLVKGWIKRANSQAFINMDTQISVGHPQIFELIGLPRNYDTLMEETIKRRCPTTGKDVTDPMLCLFCGEIFCGQSICCAKEDSSEPGRSTSKIGGAQQHMQKYA